jgi:hypothetical protein
MSGKVAVFLTNYNMPEKADALYEYIDRHTSWETDIYLVDNGSDLVAPAVHTNTWLEKNMQTTAGWLAGLKAAKKFGKYFAYAFLITSADFDGIENQDPITPMAELLEEDENAVGVHAALTLDSTTSWMHLLTRGGTGPRRTWFIDNVFSMYRAEWFDSIGWFDPDMRYAWGVDLETCWHARLQKRGLYVHEGVRIRKITDIGYTMNRMNMSADDRRHKAGQNMEIVLSQKYGDQWWQVMTEQFVEPEWR